jgi:chromate transporter
MEVVRLMGRLGLTSFGGPAAHVALMEHEVVRRRAWIGRDEFLDLVALMNLIPGPNATEMAIQLGYLRARWPGFLLAGLAFILPGAILSGLLAWTYERYGAVPQLEQAFRLGIHPVVLAILVSATWRLGRAAIRDRVWLLWGAGGLAAQLLGLDPIWVLLAAGIAALFRTRIPWSGSFLVALLATPGATNAASVAVSQPLSVGLFFLKVGALLFGSGMVLFAFIERDVVAMGWLTQSQLTDAIAVGQMTPGPVLSSATFIGWLLAGPFGAAAATVGAFLPAFAIMVLVAPNVRRLRELRWAKEILAGVSAAVVGIILGVAVRIAAALVWDAGTALLFPVALVLLASARAPTWAIILLGAAIGGLRIL